MRPLAHAWRSLRREALGGDLLTVALALVLGVAVMTAVGTLVSRVQTALTQSAGELIGGDLGIAGRVPPPAGLAAEAEGRGLRHVHVVSFPSVLFAGEASQLAEIKGVTAAYPLRGALVVDRGDASRPETVGAPAPGEAYADGRVLSALGLRVGDALEFGGRPLRVAARLQAEPDSAGELFQLAPRVLVNMADVDAGGLLGPGSRAQHRFMLAGDAPVIEAMRPWLRENAPQHRLVTLEDTQEAVRGSFDRASRFLALSALLAVLLAGVATALAANRFALRRIDQVAILRCLGARQDQVLSALALQLLLLAIPACAVGVGVGMLAQAGLVEALGALIPQRLPLPPAAPALAGAAIGAVLLLGFGLPPLLRLRGVPPMRVLNRSFATLPPSSAIAYLAALAATAALAVYATRDARLAFYVLGGLAGLALLAAGVGWAMLASLRLLQGRLRGAARLGLASLARRRGLGVVQLVGLSLSLCALLMLAAIGPALLRQWQERLPAETPNYFLLNVQPDQRDAVLQRLRDAGVREPSLEPFSTGRLLAVNGQPPRRFNDEGQERRPDPDEPAADERPLNFSFARTLPPANTIVEGAFWAPDSTAPEASIEDGFARRYGLALGDTLTVQVGERELVATVSNIREAQWDSFRVNFFLLLNEGAVADAPYNLISSVFLPPERKPELATLTRDFPNISMLDIDQILGRVREVIERVSQAVQLVLGFSLAAGVLVLAAALQATAGERRFESAVLRTLGARRGQLRAAVLWEFGLLGLLAALLGVGGAAAIGTVISTQLFELPLDAPWGTLLASGAGGIALSLLAGLAGTRRILSTPPARALRAE